MYSYQYKVVESAARGALLARAFRNREGVATWPPPQGLKLKQYAISVFHAVKRGKISPLITPLMLS